MRRKVIALLLCGALAASVLAGCGSAKEEANAPAESSTAESGENAEQTEEDAETEETAEAEDQDTGAVNEYGLTDAQQEALLASVKESVTTEYLEKYNIAPADFKLLPYDANDLNNYEGETYTGTDPYESASVWNVVDDVIGKTQNWELTALAMGMDTEDDLEFAADFIESPELVFAGTLEEQNALNKEVTGGAFVLDTSTQKYALENALYMGIAEFLNGLSDTERAQVLVNLYAPIHGQEPVVMESGFSAPSAVLFDRVICDNIQFE